MAAHLTKQIPAAPVVKASAALYWLPAFFLHLMVKANSLDEVFMHFLLYYRLMNLKLCKTDYWHRCRDLTRFFFFFHPPLMNVRGAPPDAFYCCCKVIDALASAAFTHVTSAEKHISIREDSTDVYFSNEKNFDINL